MVENNQLQWEHLVELGMARLSAHNYCLEKLTDTEQELATLWRFEADVSNGGLVQFFCNWGPQSYDIAHRALRKIEADRAREALEEFYSVIERFQDDEKIKNLWDIAEFLNDKELEIITRLDKEYWENHLAEISVLAVNFYSAV